VDIPLCFALVAWFFWMHHAWSWSRRRGALALYRLERLASSGDHARIEFMADALQRHPHVPPRVRAIALRCRAWARLCLGKLKQALDDVHLSLEWNARDGRTYLVLAMICWESDPQRALEALEEARKRKELWRWKPVENAIRTYQALALTVLRRGPEALACFESSPLSSKAPFQRQQARALALCGRFQEALERLRKVGEPDEYLTLSAFLFRAEKPEEALFWANRSLDERLSLTGISLKGAALASLGRHREMDECMEQWRRIVTRPADFTLHPALTDFGRKHLMSVQSNGLSCN
jgi:tetratricopeptide (TPR) repeat protein